MPDVTVQHDRTSQRITIETILIEGAGMVAVGVMLGVVVGLAIPNSSLSTETSDAQQVGPTALSHEEFLRLNTTDLERLSPTVPAQAVDSQAVDPFLYWNTTALDGLVPTASDETNAGMVTRQFLEWNTASLEYPVASYSEPSNGPR